MEPSDDSYASLLKHSCDNLRRRLRLIKNLWLMRGGSKQLWFDADGSKKVRISHLLAGLSAISASEMACPPGLQEAILAEDFSYASCLERFKLDGECARTKRSGEAHHLLLPQRWKPLKLKRVKLDGHHADTKGSGKTQDGPAQQRRQPLKMKRLKVDRHRACTKNSEQPLDVLSQMPNNLDADAQRRRETQDVSAPLQRCPPRKKKRFNRSHHRESTKKSEEVQDALSQQRSKPLRLRDLNADTQKIGEDVPSKQRQQPLGSVKLDGHRVKTEKCKKVQDATSQQQGQLPSMNELKSDSHHVHKRRKCTAPDTASQRKQQPPSNDAQNSNHEAALLTRKGSSSGNLGVQLDTAISRGRSADDANDLGSHLVSAKFGPQPLVRLFQRHSLCPRTLIPKDAKMLKCKPLNLRIRAAVSVELVTEVTSLGHHSAAVPEFLGMVPEGLLPADDVPDQSVPWRILLIAGPSGSGKTSLIRSIHRQLKLGTQDNFYPSAAWVPGRAIIEQFPGGLEVAQDYLCGLGLSSVPSWCKPYTALSIGEQYRANAARSLAEADGQCTPLLFDEWTSELDRGVARSVCAALRRWLASREKQGRRCPPLVLATCHNDVEAFLQPDMLVRCEAGLAAKVMHLQEEGRSQSSAPELRSVFKGIVDPLPPKGTILGQWRATMHDGVVSDFGVHRCSPARVEVVKGSLKTKLSRCDGSLDISDQDVQMADEWYYASLPENELEMRMKFRDDGRLNLQSRFTTTLAPEFNAHLVACKQLKCTHLASIAGVAGVLEPPGTYAQHLAGRLAAIATLWKLSPFEEHAVTRCPAQRTSQEQRCVQWLLSSFEAYLRGREEQLQQLPDGGWSPLTFAERVPVLRVRSCDWMFEAGKKIKREEGEDSGEDCEENEMRDTVNSAKTTLNCYDWPRVRRRLSAAGWYQPPNEEDLCPGMLPTKVICTAPAFNLNPRLEHREPAAVHLASYVGEGNGGLSATLQQVEVLLDGSFDGLCVHVVPKLNASTQGIGVIFGPTGSGKTTFAREKYGEPLMVQFDEGLPAAAHFRSLEEAQSSLAAVELELSKVLCPVTALSGGERERLVLAWGLAEWASGRLRTLLVDEFTSLLDRELAKRVANGITAFAKAHEGKQEDKKTKQQQQQQQLIFLTSHLDILGCGLLEPDWAFDCGRARLLTFRRPESSDGKRRRWPRSSLSINHERHSRCLPKPRVLVAASMRLEVRRALPCEWRHFREHHYKDHCLQQSAVCFVGMLDGRAIVFTAILHQGYTVRNLLKAKDRDVDQTLVQMGFPLQRGHWLLLREHRTVVLPDCQGLGVGSLMADTIASVCERMGYAFMSVTAHPTYGGYRERSPLWAALPSSRRERPLGQAVTFSHLWLGADVDGVGEAEQPINRRIDLQQMSCYKNLAGT